MPEAPRAQPPLRSPQGPSGGGLVGGSPRAALRLVPRGGVPVAEAVTSAITSESLLTGGVLLAAGGSVVLVCLTASAAWDGRETPLDIADTFYGTHFGDIQGWSQGCYAPGRTEPSSSPERTPEVEQPLEPHVSSEKESSANRRRDRKRMGRIYVTYTKLNRITRRTYSGRTSMPIDLSGNLETQANLAVASRDSSHHVNQDENDEPKSPGFLPAVRDEFDVGTSVNYMSRYDDIAYWRIRGREQQLMDFHGGAQSDTHAPHFTENVHRGVAKDNPLGRLFHDAATQQWGQLHPYTGD